MKNPALRPISEVPHRQAKIEITIGIDLATSGAITERSTRMEKLLIEDDSGPPRGAIEKWFTFV